MTSTAFHLPTVIESHFVGESSGHSTPRYGRKANPSALKQEDTGDASVQTIDDAIAQNVDIELKVTKAADDLDQVNAQLATQVARQSSMATELAETRSSLARALDDLSESQSQERDARQKALKDPLTGIPNRVSFDQALDHGLMQARRHGWQLAVLFADIDEFKSINDSYGHDAGDRVLLMVANRLQSFLRGGDTVCRWGGDEFACLLPQVRRADDLGHLANQLIGLIAADCEIDGTVHSVRVSIGAALYPTDGETAESLLRSADAAMFRAKGTRKRVVAPHRSRGAPGANSRRGPGVAERWRPSAAPHGASPMGVYDPLVENEVKIYVDGVLEDSAPHSAQGGSSAGFGIGGHGLFDELSFYGWALSDEEVEELYLALWLFHDNFESGAVCAWSFSTESCD